MDEIAQILTDHKSEDKRIEKFEEYKDKYKCDFLDENTIKAISKIDGFTGYHSLSFDAINEMLDDLQNTSDNQMQIIWEKKMGENNLNDLKGMKNIPFDDEKVYSPVARRAEREAIKIINTIRKKYGELDSIVIEMPRDKNSDEQRKNEKNRQKVYSEQKKRVDEILGKEKYNVSGKTKLKIRLYKEQGEKCIYSGEPIELRTLIEDENAYQIDHIIPQSISFDDSLANKVICKTIENQKKGQQTPYAYFKSGNASRSYGEFKKHVLATNFKRKKREYLLLEADVSKYENQKQFINRNLVDTRYASRALLNMLERYMKANEINTKIHVIRGSVTSGFRKKAKIKKDRDESYSHHAIDALIVAGIKKMKFMDNVLNVVTEKTNSGDDISVDRITGEILTLENEADYFDSAYIELIKNLRDDLKGKIKYSHKVDKKPNRKMSNETIYGIREIDGKERIIGKYSDIYGVSGEEVAKLFRTEKNGKLKATKLLMYRNDEITFEILKKVCESYKDEKNPFSAYHRDNNDYIRKHGKKNGPIINSLRYDSKELGVHQDISHKYQKGNKVVKLSINTFRLDIYQGIDGDYKFMRVIYSDINQNKDGYKINSDKYNLEKSSRGISDEYEFLFSLYKGDLFGYTQSDEDEIIVRYNGVDYNANKIEFKERDRNTEGQNFVTISKKVKGMTKYSTDILGNMFRINNEICKMKIDMI